MNNNDLRERNLYSIKQNIKNTYSLNDLTFDFLHLNYEKIYEQYGFIIPTINNEIIIKKNEMGIGFTEMIENEFIEKLKLTFSDNINFNHNYLNKNFILNFDLTKYKNINLEQIGLLNVYSNNDINFKNYLELLNNCDEETRNLILEIIKPLSFDEFDNIFYDKKLFSWYNSTDHHTNFFNYIIDDTKENDIGLDKKYHMKYKERNNKINIFFLKEFEYFFINNFDLFNEIIKRDNKIDILQKILKIKEYLYNNIPIANGSIKEETIYGTIEYDSMPFKSNCHCYETYIGEIGKKKIDNINFHQKKILTIKKILVILLKLIVDEKIDCKEFVGIEQEDYINELLSIVENERKVKKLCK